MFLSPYILHCLPCSYHFQCAWRSTINRHFCASNGKPVGLSLYSYLCLSHTDVVAVLRDKRKHKRRIAICAWVCCHLACTCAIVAANAQRKLISYEIGRHVRQLLLLLFFAHHVMEKMID